MPFNHGVVSAAAAILRFGWLRARRRAEEKERETADTNLTPVHSYSLQLQDRKSSNSDHHYTATYFFTAASAAVVHDQSVYKAYKMTRVLLSVICAYTILSFTITNGQWSIFGAGRFQR